MKILDGRHVSKIILSDIRDEVDLLMQKGIRPKIAVILVGKNPASLAYIRQKQRACAFTDILWEQFDYPEDIDTEALLKKIKVLNEDKNTHGILVQLPLAKQIDSFAIIEAISPKKDVDGFTVSSLGNMFLSRDFEVFAPCTPKGVFELLDNYGITIKSKEVCIIGHSNIVGKPLSLMFLNRDATVTNCHAFTPDLKKFTKTADIVCVGVGKANLLTADMVKKGAIVIDIGFNRDENGLMSGDVDFESVKKKASYITPVPGGVGPMTVAALMQNVVNAAKLQNLLLDVNNLGDIYL